MDANWKVICLFDFQKFNVSFFLLSMGVLILKKVEPKEWFDSLFLSRLGINETRMLSPINLESPKNLHNQTVPVFHLLPRTSSIPIHTFQITNAPTNVRILVMMPNTIPLPYNAS